MVRVDIETLSINVDTSTSARLGQKGLSARVQTINLDSTHLNQIPGNWNLVIEEILVQQDKIDGFRGSWHVKKVWVGDCRHNGKPQSAQYHIMRRLASWTQSVAEVIGKGYALFPNWS